MDMYDQVSPLSSAYSHSLEAENIERTKDWLI